MCILCASYELKERKHMEKLATILIENENQKWALNYNIDMFSDSIRFMTQQMIDGLNPDIKDYRHNIESNGIYNQNVGIIATLNVAGGIFYNIVNNESKSEESSKIAKYALRNKTMHIHQSYIKLDDSKTKLEGTVIRLPKIGDYKLSNPIKIGKSDILVIERENTNYVLYKR